MTEIELLQKQIEILQNIQNNIDFVIGLALFVIIVIIMFQVGKFISWIFS